MVPRGSVPVAPICVQHLGVLPSLPLPFSPQLRGGRVLPSSPVSAPMIGAGTITIQILDAADLANLAMKRVISTGGRLSQLYRHGAAYRWLQWLAL